MARWSGRSMVIKPSAIGASGPSASGLTGIGGPVNPNSRSTRRNAFDWQSATINSAADRDRTGRNSPLKMLAVASMCWHGRLFSALNGFNRYRPIRAVAYSGQFRYLFRVGSSKWPVGRLRLSVSGGRDQQQDSQPDIKRPPVRGGVNPSGLASPFFLSWTTAV